MSLVIPDETLRYAGMSEAELREEIAILLFQKDRLTLGQASQLAEMGQLQFQRLLGTRQIGIHYGVEELEEDLKTLQR
jgi:predicted HTH domain antitoxin